MMEEGALLLHVLLLEGDVCARVASGPFHRWDHSEQNKAAICSAVKLEDQMPRRQHHTAAPGKFHLSAESSGTGRGLRCLFANDLEWAQPPFQGHSQSAYFSKTTGPKK